MTLSPVREACALVLLLFFGALLLARHAGVASAEFDEQVYLASADLLTRGFELGRDVFSSQPPLFLTALGEAHSAFGGDPHVLRILSVALTIAGAAAAWALVRSRSGAFAGLCAAVLVVVSPGVVEAAAVVSADVPCVALGTLALLAASEARRRPAWALAAGLLLSCALMTKFLAAPFAVAIVVSAIAGRPPRAAYAWFAAGVGIAALGALLTYSDVIGPLWHGAVTLHLEARGQDVDLPPVSILMAVVLIASAYLGLGAILVAGLIERGRPAQWARDHADLLALLAAGIALCAVQRPLLNHHLVVIAWPLALLAASSLPARVAPRRLTLGLAVVGVALIVPWAVHGRDTVAQAQRHDLRSAAEHVAAITSHDELVVSDLPAVPVLAGRPANPATVDPSYVRVQSGELSGSEILAAARRSGAVVIGRAFRGVGELKTELTARYGPPARASGLEIWDTHPQR